MRNDFSTFRPPVLRKQVSRMNTPPSSVACSSIPTYGVCVATVHRLLTDIVQGLKTETSIHVRTSGSSMKPRQLSCWMATAPSAISRWCAPRNTPSPKRKRSASGWDWCAILDTTGRRDTTHVCATKPGVSVSQCRDPEITAMPATKIRNRR